MMNLSVTNEGEMEAVIEFLIDSIKKKKMVQGKYSVVIRTNAFANVFMANLEKEIQYSKLTNTKEEIHIDIFILEEGPDDDSKE